MSKVVFPICKTENRPLDGFDLLSILGLVKEYNWKEIWKKYLPPNQHDHSISLYVGSELYFMELHVQKMQRIILSEKFNTNPFFMQQVIQRIFAGHDHQLILQKIRKQGIDTGENPICLSCSMGNTIIDFIANKSDVEQSTPTIDSGKTYIETTERRALDVFDLSSTLYLCQQNLSSTIYRRYGQLNGDGDYLPQVELDVVVAGYRIQMEFQSDTPEKTEVLPGPGNVSVATIHQVLERINFGHSSELIAQDLQLVGISLSEEELNSEFVLARKINNTVLQVAFTKLSQTDARKKA